MSFFEGMQVDETQLRLDRIEQRGTRSRTRCLDMDVPVEDIGRLSRRMETLKTPPRTADAASITSSPRTDGPPRKRIHST
jgi:hypothetical protein